MTKTLDEAAVRHVATLARLDLTDEEIARFTDQLSPVLDYMEQLNELEVTDVPPTAHALEVRNVFREDTGCPSWGPQEALSNAPDRQGDFFRVPKVLDQESA